MARSNVCGRTSLWSASEDPAFLEELVAEAAEDFGGWLPRQSHWTVASPTIPWPVMIDMAHVSTM